MTNSISPLAVVAGPTASGKSALALWLAKNCGGEIVNADSLQIYRGMDIGSAKVQPAEREGIAHHLFDVRNPDEVFTAGEYSRLARTALSEIAARGAVPIVVGGAGFYLRALFDGLAPSPASHPGLRERFERAEARRPGMLHRALRRWDARAAERIHAKDLHKLIRALEVMYQARQPLSAVQSCDTEALTGFRSLWIGLEPNREMLRARIQRRTTQMFADGLVEEVQRLREAGYGPGAKAMESVGYKQVQAYLDGRMSLEMAQTEITLRTGQYAKRQLTWFRKETATRSIQWLRGFGHEPAIQAQAESLLKQLLTEPIEKIFR